MFCLQLIFLKVTLIIHKRARCISIVKPLAYGRTLKRQLKMAPFFLSRIHFIINHTTKQKIYPNIYLCTFLYISQLYLTEDGTREPLKKTPTEHQDNASNPSCAGLDTLKAIEVFGFLGPFFIKNHLLMFSLFS